MTDAKLKSLAERIENLMDERDGIQSDIRDIYTEAKGVGYVPKVLRKAITRKRMDVSKRDEEDAILDLYESALSPAMRKVVAMAKAGAKSREIEQATGVDHATVARSVALNKKSATDTEHTLTRLNNAGEGLRVAEGSSRTPRDDGSDEHSTAPTVSPTGSAHEGDDDGLDATAAGGGPTGDALQPGAARSGRRCEGGGEDRGVHHGRAHEGEGCGSAEGGSGPCGREEQAQPTVSVGAVGSPQGDRVAPPDSYDPGPLPIFLRRG
jgi:uncharacterized protein (UPF0335 family)